MFNRFAKRTTYLPDTTSAQKIKSLIVEERNKGHHVIGMEVGLPNFDTPEYIKRAAIESLERGEVFYCDGRGLYELREAIAGKLRRDNNLHYTPEEVLVTCGGTEGIYTTINAICDEGDEILICDPIWDNYMTCCDFLNVKAKFYHLREENDFQVDVEELASLVTERTKMIVLVSPNNPQGVLFNMHSLEGIARVAKEHDLVVLSDEMYDKILYTEQPMISIASLPEMRNRTITLNGFSKALSMTGWRMGYLAAPQLILNQLYKVHAQILMCLPTFIQKAAAVALSNTKEYDAAIAHMLKEYKERRDYLVTEINKIPGLSCRLPEGAFYAFINFSGLGMTSEEAQDFLLYKTHIASRLGTTFSDGTSDGYVRLCYAVSMDDITLACERIKVAVEELKTKK